MRRHESETVDCWTLRWRLPQLSFGTGDTLCVSRQRTVQRVAPGSLKTLRSIRRVHTAIAGRLYVRVQVCRDDSATARDEDATEVCRRTCSRATNSRSADACPYATNRCDESTPTRDKLETAQSVAAVDDMSGEEGSGDILGRPHSSIKTSLRNPHVNLGHPKTTSQHVISSTHVTQQTLEAARYFECPACEPDTSNALRAELPNTLVRHDSHPHVDNCRAALPRM